MSGKLVLDTNIVMYLLDGDETVSSMLQDTETYVSFITELELLSYHRLSETERLSKICSRNVPLLTLIKRLNN